MNKLFNASLNTNKIHKIVNNRNRIQYPAINQLFYNNNATIFNSQKISIKM